MPTKKLCKTLLLILLIGCTQGLEGCDSVQIKEREPCFINGKIIYGATCASTITQKTSQLSMQEALDMLEARPDGGADHPAHPPAVFESAKDYGEETVELESACRLLGDKCTYQVVQHIEARRQILNALQNPQ